MTLSYNLIKDNQNYFLELLIKKYISDNNFILKFLSFYKSNVFIDNFHLNHLMNKEKKNSILHFFFLYTINVQN